jgi:uncharacterized cupredoxin-like copper-binding protein
MRPTVQRRHPRPAGAGPWSRAAWALAPFVLALAGGLTVSHPARSSPAAIELVAREFSLSPKDMIAQAGDVALVVKNNGELEHNLVVESPDGRAVVQVAILEPGEMRRVHAVLPAGTYRLYCSLPGHKEAGMVATLRVGP